MARTAEADVVVTDIVAFLDMVQGALDVVVEDTEVPASMGNFKQG